jgi:hypothetical protein
MFKAKSLVLILTLLLMVSPAFAQQTPTPTLPPPISPESAETVDPNANISWPPPVYVVRGQFDIRGSANLPNQTNYFVEYRPYAPTLTLAEETQPWFPVSLPSNAAVQNDVLATWDTTVAPDGVYELRLTVNVSSGAPVLSLVYPVRVENVPPPFAVIPTIAAPTLAPPQLIPTLTLPPQLPTQPPPPTAAPTQDNTPRATISTANANIRTGDTTFHNVIGSQPQGTVLTIIGVSANNTGWFQVQLPDGRIGWVAPSVVNVSGNVNGVPRVQPPPPPITPTPTQPPATATPITSANLVAGIVQLSNSNPDCNETFTVGLDVANLGSGATSGSGVVSLQDTARGGTVTETTIGGFPVLNPGQTFRVNMPVTVDTFYDEDHTIVLTIDAQNQIPETNENDNRQTITYHLDRGSC